MTELSRNRDDVQPSNALSASVGVASPLWVMFTGAATAGIAYWWMTRWLKPTNLEALYGEAAAAENLAAPEEVPPSAETLEAAPAEAVVEATEAVADSESIGLATTDEVPPPAPNPEPPILEAQPPAVAPAKPKAAKKASPANGAQPPVEPS